MGREAALIARRGVNCASIMVSNMSRKRVVISSSIIRRVMSLMPLKLLDIVTLLRKRVDTPDSVA